MPAFEEETKEQYEAIMELSKIANRNIAHKLAKAKNLDLPFKTDEVRKHLYKKKV